MNTKIITCLLVVISLGFLTRAAAADRWETLRAINLVENPTNQTRMGSRGELGPYQFRVGTWKMHTQKPFNMANDRAAADEVAIAHYEWLKRGLVNAGVDANTYNIAMAWNCGLTAVVEGRIPAASYRYAEQVTNLTDGITRHAKAVVATVKAPAAPESPKFQLQFGDEEGEPRYVVVTSPDAPRLVLANDSPRFVIAPATLGFTLAITN